MIVLDVINEALYSREDFIKSFNDRQWNNILVFFTQEKLSAAKTLQARTNELDNAATDVGPKTKTEDPSQWNKVATRYRFRNHQMATNKSYPSWQDIHDHLKQYAEKSVELPGVSNSVPQSDITVDRDKVGEWAEWTGNLSAYLEAWFKQLEFKRKQPWRDELGARAIDGSEDGGDNKMIQGWKIMVKRLKNTRNIEKWQVDAELLAWLQTADKLITSRMAARAAANGN